MPFASSGLQVLDANVRAPYDILQQTDSASNSRTVSLNPLQSGHQPRFGIPSVRSTGLKSAACNLEVGYKHAVSQAQAIKPRHRLDCCWMRCH